MPCFLWYFTPSSSEIPSNSLETNCQVTWSRRFIWICFLAFNDCWQEICCKFRPDHWILESCEWRATGQAGSLVPSSSSSGQLSAGISFWLRFWFNKNHFIVYKPPLHRFNPLLISQDTVYRRDRVCLGAFLCVVVFCFVGCFGVWFGFGFGLGFF